MPRIPLDLFVEVETADGARYRWDANQAPGSRLRGFSFRTKLGEGFSDASGQLARRIDLDYPDLNLVQSVNVVGADGSTAYEGRLAAMPRELSDTHQIGVTLAGWMAHAKDRKFAEVYVDREISAWDTSIPLNERVRLATATVDFASMNWGADGGTLAAALPNQALGSLVTAQAWYTAPPGVTIAKLQYKGTETTIPVGWAGASFRGHTSDLYDAGTSEAVSLTLDGTLRTATFATARRYLDTELFSSGTAATPAAGANRTFTKLAAYGNHDLTTYTGDPAEPQGVYLSDVIRDITNRWCPMLNTDGVQDFQYVVQHCAFRDRTYPYDAYLDLNKYALQHLAVWENRTLHFRPYDFSDYGWEIRTDDQGTTFSPQGPSTDDLFNGIVVTYTDLLTGRRNVVTPDDDSTLADTSTENPWNQWGIPKWDELEISSPQLEADALQIGRARLAETNRPKTPGTITVRGYVRDRAGTEQPVWKVRAGDTIAVTNFPNDTPRLVTETAYDDESKTVTLSIDRPSPLLDAFLERLANARLAAGLA